MFLLFFKLQFGLGEGGLDLDEFGDLVVVDAGAATAEEVCEAGALHEFAHGAVGDAVVGAEFFHGARARGEWLGGVHRVGSSLMKRHW